ncbi:cation transporting ATPase C-terminal domain-containing protein [Nonomuraea wenchangensis]
MQRLALFDLDNTLINLDEAFKVWSAEFAKEHALGAEATAWRAGLLPNRWVIGGVAVQAAGQLALTCLPAMNGVFGTAPIGGNAWLRILAVAAVATVVVAVDKRLRAPSTPG